MRTFYHRTEEGFEPTVYTRGPWDERFQHGGPPSALLLRQLTEAVAAGEGGPFAVARLSTEYLRPVPVAPLQVQVEEPMGGRSVRRVTGRLLAGDRLVMEARAVFLRQRTGLGHQTATRPGHEGPPWPTPEELEPFEFPFFAWDEGYHRGVDIRVVDEPWGTTPVRCWGRVVLPLVDQELPAPEEAVTLLADAESGMGPPLDMREFTFLNPDLTVYFGRRPQPGWVGLAVRSRADGDGVGLSESELRDPGGVFGRSAQALVIAPRGG